MRREEQLERGRRGRRGPKIPTRPLAKALGKNDPAISRLAELKSGRDLGPQDFLGPEAMKCFERTASRS